MEITNFSKNKPQKHFLPKLKYEFNDLEPIIDKETIEIHYTKHHQSYVDGINKAEESIENIRKIGDYSGIKFVKKELSFNLSGHLLHSLYWENMCPVSKSLQYPQEKTEYFIKNSFGSFENFINEFKNTALNVEGSGWAILSYLPKSDSLVALSIEKHQDLDSLSAFPILVCDVWEHAYYLKYLNNRKLYIENWFKIINWVEVERRLIKACQGKYYLNEVEKIIKY